MTWTSTVPNAIDYNALPINQLLQVKLDALGPVDFIVVRDRLLQHWEITKKTLAHAKEVEMEYRTACVKLMADPAKSSGTQNVDLGQGYKAKMVLKENVSFIKNDEGKVDVRAIENVLTTIEKTVEGGALIAERLVSWTPEFKQSEYKLLTPALKKLVDTILVTKAGASTLEIVAPKAAK